MQNRESSSARPQRRFYSSRKKFCHFCKERILLIDYKNARVLENYISETGKIMPARVMGTCRYHQKQLGKAIKRARHMSLIKFVENKRSRP